MSLHCVRRLSLSLFVYMATVFLVSRPSSSWGFSDGFDANGCIEEAGSMSQSASPDWWVNSGGRLCRTTGVGSTVMGSLPSGDYWRTLYGTTNPVDTDDGYHPQNIFRFVTKGLWKDFQQTVFFRIRALNRSASPNRNASNGILFFQHYQDGNNLYYAGIRVDGAAVIKKKMGGSYTTMAFRSGVYPGAAYNAASNPTLLPSDRWIGLRTVTETTATTVTLRLELNDPVVGGGWVPLIEAEDSGQYGGPAITVTGHAGIRTDFMDVEFNDYDAIEIADNATPAPTATPTFQPTPAPTATPQPQPTAPPPTATPTPQPACAISVSPLNQSFGGGGGSAASSVNTAATCSWRATSSASWLTITSGSSGSGNGTVSYSAPANTTSQSRSATISVGGKVVTVTQSKRRK